MNQVCFRLCMQLFLHWAISPCHYLSTSSSNVTAQRRDNYIAEAPWYGPAQLCGPAPWCGPAQCATYTKIRSTVALCVGLGGTNLLPWMVAVQQRSATSCYPILVLNSCSGHVYSTCCGTYFETDSVAEMYECCQSFTVFYDVISLWQPVKITFNTRDLP